MKSYVIDPSVITGIPPATTSLPIGPVSDFSHDSAAPIGNPGEGADGETGEPSLDVLNASRPPVPIPPGPAMSHPSGDTGEPVSQYSTIGPVPEA